MYGSQSSSSPSDLPPSGRSLGVSAAPVPFHGTHAGGDGVDGYAARVAVSAAAARLMKLTEERGERGAHDPTIAPVGSQRQKGRLTRPSQGPLPRFQDPLDKLRLADAPIRLRVVPQGLHDARADPREQFQEAVTYRH